jgi:hypothetical protein
MEVVANPVSIYNLIRIPYSFPSLDQMGSRIRLLRDDRRLMDLYLTDAIKSRTQDLLSRKQETALARAIERSRHAALEIDSVRPGSPRFKALKQPSRLANRLQSGWC